LIVTACDSALETDTFLLSCRALGRGVEHRMLAFLGELAVERGLRSVDVTLQRTSKNLPAQQFFESLEGERWDDGTRLRVRLSAQQARGVLWKPALPVEKPRVKRAAAPAPPHQVNFRRIAERLSTPEQILAAVRGTGAAIEFEPMSETEGKLAAIWAELLGRTSIAPGDNFFDLGGHSLLAVLLVVRVKEAFGVELPIDDVYSAGVTLRDLAVKIDTYRLSGSSQDEYAALVAEIESLSDEEVRRLLEQEDTAAAS
jgi:acyl carrier protein